MSKTNEQRSDGAFDSIRPPATITVIGLGNMGQPMAACLKKAGYDVIGFDASEAARWRFSDNGGRAAADLKSAVEKAEVIITLLPDGKIVRTVVASMKPHLKPGALVIDMSSSDPIGTRAVGEEMTAAGFSFLDAPVSGGVKRAVNGTLAIMVGGGAETIDRVEPILSAMGSSIFHTGALGSGHAMKALNNYVSAAGLTAAVEALEIGKAFGLDPSLMTDVFNASTGKNNSTENKLKQFVISEHFGSGFLLRLMAKDIRTAADLAAVIGVPAPLADRCAALWDDAVRSLGDGADHTEIGRHIAKLR